MAPKHLVFLLVALILVPAGTFLARAFPRVRDACFVLAVALTVDLGLFDVNFLSREFYRAATRGIEVSLLDLLAAIVLLSTPSGRPRPWPAGLGAMTAYTAWAAATIPLGEPRLFGWFELSKLLRGILVFVAAARYVQTRREVTILVGTACLVMGYEGLVALQHRYLYHHHRVSGTLGHPNNLAMYANMVAPLMLTAVLARHRTWLKWAAGLVYLLSASAVVLTISRTGFAVLLVVLYLTLISCVSLKLSAKQIAGGLLGLALVAGGAYRARDSLSARYAEATLEQEATAGRGTYFVLGRMVFSDHPLGIGLNNWSYVVTNQYYPRLGVPYRPYTGTDVDFSGYSRMEALHMVAPPAHNLLVLTLGELGLPGLVLFCIVWYRWFALGLPFVRRHLTDPVSRFGAGVFFSLVALFLSCLTEYGFRHSPIFFLTHILVGALAGVRATARLGPGWWASMGSQRPAPQSPESR